MNTIEQLWYVVYTKPKHEKTVEKNLSEQSFETFLPLIKKHKKWSDRKKWVTFPLFKSYVFVHSTPSKIQEVLATKGIVKLVKFNKSPAIIKENEINNIKIMLNGNYDLQNTDYFQKGNKAQVIEGPLKGLKGEVYRIGNNDRLLIRVDAIQHSISIQIERSYLKLL